MLDPHGRSLLGVQSNGTGEAGKRGPSVLLGTCPLRLRRGGQRLGGVVKVIDDGSIKVIDGICLVVGQSNYRWPLLCLV